MRSSFLVAALFVLVPISASATPIMEATVEGWPWKFPIPAGFCAVDPTKPSDKPFFEVETKLAPPSVIVASLMYECDGLEKLRKGERSPVKELSYVVAKDESLTPFVRLLSRLEYIHAMVQQIPVAGTANLANDAAKQIKDKAGLAASVPRFSLIAQDEYAFYGAALTNVAVPGHDGIVSIASVSGGTKIGMHLFTVRLIELYDTDKVYEPMLAAVKATTKAFLLANPH